MNKCKTCGKKTKGVYCNNKCQQELAYKVRVADFLVGKYVGKRMMFSEGRWNKRLLKETFGNKCNICGIEDWQGKPIVFEVNHIDGRAYNNTMNNLELICLNCHSQTETFRNKNKNSDRTYR
jgi:hypothetical protein